MRRALLAFSLLIGMILESTPAQADHAGSVVFFSTVQGDRWVPPETYCESPDFDELLGSGSADGARASIINGVERWENNTQIPDLFTIAGAACNDFNFEARWNNNGAGRGSYCASIPSSEASSFQLDSLDGTFPGSLAVSVSCDRDGNGKIDYFTVAFNRDALVGQNGTRWDYEVGPQSGEFDFLGIVMHEFGHAIGVDQGELVGGSYSGHLIENGSACPDNSDRGTMCTGFNGLKNYAGHPGTWSRTLSVHDEGITNEEY